MITLERQDEILEQLKAKNTLSVKTLAKKLFVSEATIRRDLAYLEKQSLLRRTHGGAVLVQNEHEETGLSYRMSELKKEKEYIAEKTLPLIKNSKALFLDSSSTVAIMAKHIDMKFSTIVTTGIQTAISVSQDENRRVILLGGTVSYSLNSVNGAMTLSQLRDFNFDTAVLSCAGIDENFCVTEKTVEQCTVKREVLKNSRVKILLIDNSKFNFSNIATICSAKEFDYIVTDKKPPEEFIHFANENGIKIIY